MTLYRCARGCGNQQQTSLFVGFHPPAGGPSARVAGEATRRGLRLLARPESGGLLAEWGPAARTEGCSCSTRPVPAGIHAANRRRSGAGLPPGGSPLDRCRRGPAPRRGSGGGATASPPERRGRSPFGRTSGGSARLPPEPPLVRSGELAGGFRGAPPGAPPRGWSPPAAVEWTPAPRPNGGGLRREFPPAPVEWSRNSPPS